MRRTTQALVAVTGVAVVGIGLAHLILGGAAVIGGSPLNATAQGEHRFFAALFVCYGLAFLWCVPTIETKKRHASMPWPQRSWLAALPDSSRSPYRDRPTRSSPRCWSSSWRCRCSCSSSALDSRNPPDEQTVFNPLPIAQRPPTLTTELAPLCRHNVVSSETNQRRTDEKWSDGMTFKRVACASILAAGVGLAGLFGVGLGSASANPGQCNAPGQPPCGQDHSWNNNGPRGTTMGRATTTAGQRRQSDWHGRGDRPGPPGSSALQLERRTGHSRPAGNGAGWGFWFLGLDSAVTTPTMRRVTARRPAAFSAPAARDTLLRSIGEVGDRVAHALRRRPQAATSGPARNTSRDTAGSTVPARRPRGRAARPAARPGRPPPGRAPVRRAR